MRVECAEPPQERDSAQESELQGPGLTPPLEEVGGGYQALGASFPHLLS